jgi:hypothetical protein
LGQGATLHLAPNFCFDEGAALHPARNCLFEVRAALHLAKSMLPNLYTKEKRLAGNEPFLFWNSMNAFVDTLSCFIN